MIPLKTLTTVFFLAAWGFIGLSAGSEAYAADKENCLMCHRYRFMGRIDENGKRHTYYVDETIYNISLHRSVSCRDCHTYITKIPHDPVTEEVNCANVCHVKPPFTQDKFSHQKIIDIYNSSAHAIKPDDSAAQKKAKPYCKFCHLNPVFTRVSQEHIDYHQTLSRCLNCHEEKGVTQAYKHVTHRMRHKTSRTPQEIVALCAKCHQDKELMQTVNASPESLTSVDTYKRTLHGKSVTLGSQETADCISCHASNAIHDIYKKDDPKATIQKDNISTTCKQCHEKTNDWFIQVAVHPSTEHDANPVIHFLSIGLQFALYGTIFGLLGLLLLETVGRRKDGVKYLLRYGSSWRGQSKR